ncbi:MAG: hypothetical protein J6Z82_07235, partial [Schwartzia sp.]|nr:hypothetical protein [Schwartzia sp. (in: firmicutes)]
MSKSVSPDKTKMCGKAGTVQKPFFTSRFGGALKGAGKSSAALTLAVSLWIADGGVVSAGGDLYINIQGTYADTNNDLTYEGGPIPDGAKVSPSIGTWPTTTMTVTGGEWYDWNFYGGKAFGPEQNATNFTTDFSNLSGRINVHGADILHSAQATGNLVKGTNVDIEGSVYGSSTGNASAGLNNTVLLTNSRINGRVFGGADVWPLIGEIYSRMENNTVILDNTEVTSDVTGGLGGFVNYNTITLNNGTVGGTLSGGLGGLTNTGHTLNLFGANTAGSVLSFDTIKVQDTWTMPEVNGVQGPTFNLAWNDTAPLLSAGRFVNFGTLDIADASVLTNHLEPGTMTLLLSGTANNFASLKLKYSGGTVTLSDILILKESVRVVSEKKGVTLSGSRTNTIELADMNGLTKNAVNYVVSAPFGIDTVSLGTMTYGQGRDASAAFFGYENVTAIDATNFVFTNPLEVPTGQTTTLLAANDTLRDIAAQTKEMHYRAAMPGIAMDAVLVGEISAAGGNVSYHASENLAQRIAFAKVPWQ